ncbi:hypothetical protein BC938DRAFT_475589 [Jimgerdemannia flammicorona]|uniref:Protein PNS1 n=1 Tax=Jimgerdemannia flammicorona TaxID=994334 RepID=A0A433PRY9_9FUNG|nr:hypothetical protein BC938DRAFT_475589 [Jimgerdemannia flammicorona]
MDYRFILAGVTAQWYFHRYVYMKYLTSSMVLGCSIHCRLLNIFLPVSYLYSQSRTHRTPGRKPYARRPLACHKHLFWHSMFWRPHLIDGTAIAARYAIREKGMCVVVLNVFESCLAAQWCSLLNMKSSNASPFVYFFSACIQCLEGIIDQVNNYTIIFAGITGEDFCSAARSATKTFRRNLVSGLLTGELSVL